VPFLIRVTTNARKDIQNAIDWENGRSPGLGKRFFKDLQSKLNELSITPAIGSVRYENVRCTSTDIFSYMIHYFIDEHAQTITLIRVLSSKQKPIY